MPAQPYAYNAKPQGQYVRQNSNESRMPPRQPPNFAPPQDLGRKPTYARQAPVHRGATMRQRGATVTVDERGPPPGLAHSGTTRLNRGKTLTRPDRHVAPAPLISATPASAAAAVSERRSWFRPWTAFAHASTFWAPPFLLAACGMKDGPSRQAWREKFALCFIAVLMGGFVGFATIGLNRVLCPTSGSSTPDEFIRLGEQGGALFRSAFEGVASEERTGYVGIQGWVFNISNSLPTDRVRSPLTLRIFNLTPGTGQLLHAREPALRSRRLGPLRPVRHRPTCLLRSHWRLCDRQPLRHQRNSRPECALSARTAQCSDLQPDPHLQHDETGRLVVGADRSGPKLLRHRWKRPQPFAVYGASPSGDTQRSSRCGDPLHLDGDERRQRSRRNEDLLQPTDPRDGGSMSRTALQGWAHRQDHARLFRLPALPLRLPLRHHVRRSCSFRDGRRLQLVPLTQAR